MKKLLSILLISASAHANYGFPPVQPLHPEEEVLMHIQYANGGGGTLRCADLSDCYAKRMNFEARGAEFYCRRISITVNGVERWWRKYQ